MGFDQAAFDIRCEWGEQGVLRLAPISDVVVIIDVLSFSTCVDIVTNRRAIAFPYQWKDKSANVFAESIGAELAEKRSSSRYSLSPASLLSIPDGTRLVLPSPNGSFLSLATGKTPTLTGCLRNCRAVALVAMSYGKRIAIVPAGERWGDESLRPAFEDWVGAGAIIRHLKGRLSPEAYSAKAAYEEISQFPKNLNSQLKQCSSGQELIERGFTQDVELAAELNVSECVPLLLDGAYRDIRRAEY